MDQENLPLSSNDRASMVEAHIAELQKITDYEMREWPIEVLVEKFTNGRETDTSEIFIPDYQREMVWSAKQQSRFIESILIRLPVPFIFAADVGSGDRAGTLEIIDGSMECAFRISLSRANCASSNYRDRPFVPVSSKCAAKRNGTKESHVNL